MAERAGHPLVVFRAVTLPARRPRGEWRTNRIEVGARSSCALTLNDPVVAERHCAFYASAGRFVVEDLGSVTGTWHNGEQVREPVDLVTNDRIVVGVSRLIVRIERFELELGVEESSFHYKRAGPLNYQGPRDQWVVSDADKWVISEVRFGRIAAVSALSWAAAVLALGAGAWLLATPRGARALQPRQLGGSHAALFADVVTGHPAHNFDDARAVIATHGCGVCHAAQPPGSVASCATCHERMLYRRHPFYAGGDSDSELDPLVQRPADGCSMCHDGHAELSAADVLSAAHQRIDASVHDAARAPGICRRCHAVDFESRREESHARLAVLASLRTGEPVPTQSHAYGFASFSHRAHLAVEGGLACALCHSPAVAGEDALAPSGEFAPVQFEHCAACHVDGAVESSTTRAPEVARAREKLIRSSGLLAMNWHGTDDGCLQCHAELNKADPRTVVRTVVENDFELVRRSHTELIGRVPGKNDCANCHQEADSLDGGARVKLPFFHGAHVETLWPADTDAQQTLSKNRCVMCHAEQWSAASLEHPAAVHFDSACGRCHSDARQTDTRDAVIARERKAVQRTSTDFAHAQHTRVDGGCFACHEFQGDAPADPRAQPALKANVASCTACHSSHENIQGGACTYCHPANSAGNDTGDAILYRGGVFVRHDWPAALRFSHFSGDVQRGHTSLMTQGGRERCFSCHDADNLRAAERVDQVVIPDGYSAVCVECHADTGAWFHWALPEDGDH